MSIDSICFECDLGGGRTKRVWPDGEVRFECDLGGGRTKRVWPDGEVRYYKNGELHRKEGPAIESLLHNTKVWYRNGKRHRKEGPAFDGCDRLGRRLRKWRRHGQLHREDGPAVECDNGRKEWFEDGIQYLGPGPLAQQRAAVTIFVLEDKMPREVAALIAGLVCGL